jgi:hypothetical protein
MSSHNNMYPTFEYHQSSSVVQQFSKIYEPSQNSKRQKCDMKQFPYSGPVNIRRHGTKFSRRDDMVPKVCASLIYMSSRQCKVPGFIHSFLLVWNLHYGKRISFPGLSELEVQFVSELRSHQAAVQVWYRYRMEWARYSSIICSNSTKRQLPADRKRANETCNYWT